MFIAPNRMVIALLSLKMVFSASVYTSGIVLCYNQGQRTFATIPCEYPCSQSFTHTNVPRVVSIKLDELACRRNV